MSHKLVEIERVVEPPAKRRGKWRGYLIITTESELGVRGYPLHYGPAESTGGVVGWFDRSEDGLRRKLADAERELRAA